jgi:hypothetical protein
MVLTKVLSLSQFKNKIAIFIIMYDTSISRQILQNDLDKGELQFTENNVFDNFSPISVSVYGEQSDTKYWVSDCEGKIRLVFNAYSYIERPEFSYMLYGSLTKSGKKYVEHRVKYN